MGDSRVRAVCIGVLGLMLVTGAARAQPERVDDGKPIQGVMALSSNATVEVAKDWMRLNLSTTREGVDAAAIQKTLKNALEAALAQARPLVRPQGGLELRVGMFSLHPRYDAKGVMVGWSGTSELIVEGRDMPAIAELAGRISAMSVSNISFDISREVREKVEADVAGQAIARFRANAAAYAKAFGYGGFVIREVTLSAEPAPHPMQRVFMAKAAADGGESTALPIEAGKASVTATVSGTVQMK